MATPTREVCTSCAANLRSLWPPHRSPISALHPPPCPPPGVTKLVVAINKMDDHSVLDPSGKWSKER